MHPHFHPPLATIPLPARKFTGPDRYTLQVVCKHGLQPQIVAGFQAHPQMENMLVRYLQRLLSMPAGKKSGCLCQQLNRALAEWQGLLMLQNMETLLLCGHTGGRATQVLLYVHPAGSAPLLLQSFHLRESAAGHQ